MTKQLEALAPGRPKPLFIATVFILGLLIGIMHLGRVWMLGPDGFSPISQRLPYWDFTNLWAGGRMALDGHVTALFDVDVYRATLREMFSPRLPDQEWSYPPSMLLLGAPLATLPIFPAYLVWTFGGMLCLWLAVRPLGLGRVAEAALLLSPPVFVNAMFGQNGTLTAALLVGGLYAAPRRPVLAGLLFGLLTMKPHLGLLVPFCLLASGNWRAIAAAAVASVVVAAGTGVVFGFDVWPQFWTETRSLMTQILEAPYPQPYHHNAMTVFFMSRMAGASLTVAYAVQAAVTILAIGAAFWLWLPRRQVEHRERVVVTAVLAIVVTPYGWTYDCVALAVAAVFLLTTLPRVPVLPLALVWLWPLVAQSVNRLGIPLPGLVPGAVAAWMLCLIWLRERRAEAATVRLSVPSGSSPAQGEASRPVTAS
jgi:hypothetical protein